MAKRPTIPDLAVAAGVSIATVDRVLNGRAPVREETTRRVYEAAQRIGYHAVSLIGHRLQVDLPELTIGYVLHKEKQAFYQTFIEEAVAAAANATGVRAKAIIEFSHSQTPRDFVDCMERLAPRVDVLGATAVNHVEVTEAVQRLQASGTPCFALLNDFAQGVRKSYIGMNNIKIGRIAAHMIATAMRQKGPVALFVGGYRWHGHELRETGFRSYFREYAPQCQLLETRVNLETRQLTYEATHDLLDRHPDLAGIYCAGGGMEGAIAALRELREPNEVALVVQELTRESRLALAERFASMVIATPVAKICADMVDLAQVVLNEDAVAIPGQHFLRPDIYLPESV